MARFRTACLLCATLAGIAGAAARPSDNADPTFYGWFESLRQPGTGASCCSIADCRPTEYRLVERGYEARLDQEWVRVPAERILRGHPNPVGRAIVCRSPVDGSILCFVPASET
ncbi:MAG TPA: hypothetical protein VFW46_08680 [Stellaceae bacterium]|nr:hypothetical protein [Stellaceae bacterium]